MTALLLLEAENGKIRQSSRSALTAAQKFGAVDAVIFDETAQEAAKSLPGIGRLFIVTGVKHLLAESAASCLAEFAKNYSHILAASSSVSKDILPRLAGILDVQPITDVIEICDENSFIRPIYAGNALCKITSRDAHKILTIRASSFEPAALDGGDATIQTQEAHQAEKTTHLHLELSSSERPELDSARIVISGGKGLKDAANFETLLTPIAQKLNAAIGASRAAVDSGFAPNEIQIGQTGKIVAPELYIAVGLSGALQHLAGMKDSRIIVAINLDPEAPIFKVADYGIVGDLFELLPELERKL